MVGGKVIGIARSKESTLVRVEDRSDTCSVRCIEKRIDNGECVEISIGDSFWWQCGKCMWTPKTYIHGSGKCGKDFDIQLRKIGYSH